MSTEYEKLDFKIPIESADYLDCSNFVISQIEAIVNDSIQLEKNKIIISLMLRLANA